MKYSIILINGGDYSNIEAPLVLEANSFSNLENEIKSCFELPEKSARLMIAYCGQIIKPTNRLPRDGAMLHVSVAPPPPKPFSFDGAKEPPFRSEINEAFQFVQLHQRKPTKDRLRLIIEELLDKRYELFPDQCREDLYGARLCTNYDLFMASLSIKVMRHHEIVQSMLLEIHKVGKELLSSNRPPSPPPLPPQQPPIVPQSVTTIPQQPPIGFPQSIVPLIQSLTPQGPPGATIDQMPGGGAPTITADMLQQALNAAQQHMAQGGQTLQSQLPQNQNIQQAANEVLSEVAALAELVERGISQLREMGILQYTTEQNARRILQDNGGNVDAAANEIFEHMADFQ